MIESVTCLSLMNWAHANSIKVTVGRICIDSGSRTDVVEDLVIKRPVAT